MRLRLDGKWCARIQALFVAGALTAAAAAPPAQGTMLLISTTGLPQRAILEHAVAAGAQIAGSGRIPASLLVIGDRGRILAEALPAGIIAIAAPGALCGEVPKGPK